MPEDIYTEATRSGKGLLARSVLADCARTSVAHFDTPTHQYVVRWTRSGNAVVEALDKAAHTSDVIARTNDEGAVQALSKVRGPLTYVAIRQPS